jgi:hypothetical protein
VVVVSALHLINCVNQTVHGANGKNGENVHAHVVVVYKKHYAIAIIQRLFHILNYIILDNFRPRNGGRYCVGQRERYNPCNIIDCPWDTPGFREIQCSEFDNQDVGIHGLPPNVQWMPKYTAGKHSGLEIQNLMFNFNLLYILVSENERCKLYCRVGGSAAFYMLKDKVLDGTTCDRNGDDICIDGTCHMAGCDHRLGSNMQRDKCGICGGDGSGCQTISGVYNERGSFGYNEVMKIPAGSANIDIRQYGWNNHKDDDNYLGNLQNIRWKITVLICL